MRRMKGLTAGLGTCSREAIRRHRFRWSETAKDGTTARIKLLGDPYFLLLVAPGM